MVQILFMKPVFKQMIWGGDVLKNKWGYTEATNDTGECWGIAAHSNGDCIIANGDFAGKTLSRLWKEQPKLFGAVDNSDKPFPLLVKIIAAKSDLSIQVHPDDEYAKVHENGSLGKTECWYILDAKEGASLIVGHNAKDRAELTDMINNGKWNQFLREIPVRKGDFIQIEPGTVHAIKGGIELLETQQNSDITYRVYDYDRLSEGKPRELHIEKSIDVISVPAKSVEDSILREIDCPKNQMVLLKSCKYYNVWKIDVDGDMKFKQEYAFMNMSVVDGEGTVNGKKIRKGDHFILPFGYGEVYLSGEMQIVASSV